MSDETANNAMTNNQAENHAPDTGNDLHEEKELPNDTIEQLDPLAKVQSELTAIQDNYYRLAAEFENYKKRVARERQDLVKMAGADIFLAILPAIDDFERAIKAGGSDSVSEGIQLIYNKMKSSLEAKGLKPMDVVGKPFDLDVHEAIVQAPAPSESAKGIVLEEVTKGYFLHDKVLRYAQVIVAI